MRLSQKTIYALKAVLSLAALGEGASANIRQIVDEQGIPAPFLQIIMRDLRAAGIVESRRGKDGGYQLAIAPETLSVGQVIRCFEGDFSPAEISPVPVWPEGVFDPVWREVEREISAIYDGVSFSELVMRGQRMRRGAIHDYVI